MLEVVFATVRDPSLYRRNTAEISSCFTFILSTVYHYSITTYHY
jgi:hypothetical protein